MWAAYHGTSPEGVAARRGALITDSVDERLDVVVFGDRKGTGRAEAKKQAARLPRLKILSEAEYRALVRVELSGKRFAFVGGFDCSPAGLEDGLLSRMVEAVSGVVVTDVDPTLDYLVVGNRRGERKIATINKVTKLVEEGAMTTTLDEEAFLDLVRIDRPPSDTGALDFAGFISQLYGHVDKPKLGRALDMLRKDRFQLYAKVEQQHVVGVVRSQSSSSVYASWLDEDGKYGCSQPDLEDCMGLQGTTCKHLMVLVVGLARTGQISYARALEWMQGTQGKGPRKNATLCAETLIQYKGATAGEVDWRPTETIPEDYYAM